MLSAIKIMAAIVLLLPAWLILVVLVTLLGLVGILIKVLLSPWSWAYHTLQGQEQPTRWRPFFSGWYDAYADVYNVVGVKLPYKN
jgi:hypothetical protein